MACAFAVLIALEGLNPALHIYAFLALFVPGGLLFLGAIGIPVEVEAARKIDPDRIPRRERVEVTQARTFRYPRLGTGARIALWLTSIWMFGLGLFVLVALAGDNPAMGTAVALPMIATGALVSSLPCWQARAYFRVDGNGIQGRTYLRRQHIDWRDVAVLTRSETRTIYGQTFANVYRIYSHYEKISLSEKLDGIDALLRIVEEASGLESP